MDEALKKRLMQRYLKENSEQPINDLPDNELESYEELAAVLDYIGQHHISLFNLNTLEAKPNKWMILKNILDYACIFEKGSPPFIHRVDMARVNFALTHWQNQLKIEKLPQDDYYQRSVSTPQNIDIELNLNRVNAQAHLYALTQLMPNAKPFNKHDDRFIEKKVESLQKEIDEINKSLRPMIKENAERKTALENQLTIFQDLNKLNHLQPVSIPQKKGEPLIYYKLAEATAGVTEKVALISAAKVKTQIDNLATQKGLTIDSYLSNRDQFKLSTQAMLKLPKRKEIVEVQREAMALNISRLMGLNTASSTSVSYNNKPALFIPFDSIKELSNYATGELFKPGFGFGDDTYSHYSTIDPVGEGLQAERFIDDFGSSFALFYLSSDTDAVGGYCQNKALTNDKELFIFDQVIMDSDKFKLDSRLSLIPSQTLMKHTRHGQGRNRTLIEDSSLDTKFASLMQLQAKEKQIIKYIDRTIYLHNQRKQEIDNLRKEDRPQIEKKQLENEANDIDVLIEDARTIKTKIQQRIASISEVLPKTEGNISNNEIKQSLILEKLIHNPVLFNKLGRPYRNPWTNRQDKNVVNITSLDNDYVQLNFNKAVPINMYQHLKDCCGVSSLDLTSAKTLIISREQLNTLTEGMLHPEHSATIDLEVNYLDLSLMEQAYSQGVNKEMVALISEYQQVMSSKDNFENDKLACIRHTDKEIQKLLSPEEHKGFGRHLLKKLHLDAQQQLQTLIPEQQMPAQLTDAFNAALKLDRMAEFNKVLAEAIASKKLSNKQFLDFLDRCIHQPATNHSDAKNKSQALLIDAEQVLSEMTRPPSLLAQLQIHQEADDQLIELDPLNIMEQLLDEQHEVLMQQPNLPPSNDEDANIRIDDMEGTNLPNRRDVKIQTM